MAAVHLMQAVNTNFDRSVGKLQILSVEANFQVTQQMVEDWPIGFFVTEDQWECQTYTCTSQLGTSSNPRKLSHYKITVRHRRHTAVAAPGSRRPPDEEFHTCKNHYASLNPIVVKCRCLCHNKMLEGDYKLYSEREAAAQLHDPGHGSVKTISRPGHGARPGRHLAK
jgi:hypothetical protein